MDYPGLLLSYSGDALRSFKVHGIDHVNSDVKQSFYHSVTVRKSLLGVKLGVMQLVES